MNADLLYGFARPEEEGSCKPSGLEMWHMTIISNIMIYCADAAVRKAFVKVFNRVYSGNTVRQYMLAHLLFNYKIQE
jgi:hypothetical protein